MLQGKYPLLIALVLGLLAGLIAYSAIKSRERQVREGWETARVLCAAKDVSEGTELDEDAVSICEIPEKFVTDSFIKIQGEETEADKLPYGQKVLVPLKKGDPILYSHFESQREFKLSEGIPEKARAIAVEIPEKGTVGQWVAPNDHVDVLGTFRDDETHGLVTTTVLQNVIVLATGRITGMTTYATEEEKKYNHVILMVLPQEAELLALAQETGQLMLALRNPNDLETGGSDSEKVEVTDPKTLLTGKKRALLEKVRQTTIQTIDVIRGRERTKETGHSGAEPETP